MLGRRLQSHSHHIEADWENRVGRKEERVRGLEIIIEHVEIKGERRVKMEGMHVCALEAEHILLKKSWSSVDRPLD